MGSRLGSTKEAHGTELDDVCKTKTNTPSVVHTASNGCCKKVKKEDEFILHGIDYLSDVEKRREQRQRKLAIPRFLRIDTSLWTTSYLKLLGRMGRSSPGPEETEHQDEAETVTSSLVVTPVTGTPFDDGCECEVTELIETPVGQSTAMSDEWMSYTGYPFESIVMSGGGSKGYAYIGALKVAHCFSVHLFDIMW